MEVLFSRLAAWWFFRSGADHLRNRNGTGTGGRAVQEAIRRRALLRVNRGAVPDQLLESELFGRRRMPTSIAVESTPIP